MGSSMITRRSTRPSAASIVQVDPDVGENVVLDLGQILGRADDPDHAARVDRLENGGLLLRRVPHDEEAGGIEARGGTLDGAVGLIHAHTLALGVAGVPHEGIEMNGVGSLPKALLHPAPIGLVQLGLKLWLQAHQDEIADQVSLAQLKTCRVHALENELRIVLIAAERDIYNH